MKGMLKMIALGLSLGMVAVPATVEAQPGLQQGGDRGDHGGRDHGRFDNGHRDHDRGRYGNGYRHGRRYHGRHRVCRAYYHHHRRVTRCFYR